MCLITNKKQNFLRVFTELSNVESTVKNLLKFRKNTHPKYSEIPAKLPIIGVAEWLS